jgi:Na+:H+ antiporter
MGVELAFSVASAIILMGVVSSLLAKRMGIPEIPVLILLGIALGPATGLVGLGTLNQLAPIFGALAITIILFEGGIHIRISRVASQAGRAVALAAIGFAVSALSVTFVANYFLAWPLSTSMILGSTLGGSSSVVVFALLKRAGTPDKVGALLGMESALAEVLVVVVTSSLLQVVGGSGGADMLAVVQGIFQASTVGVILGLLGGVFWLKMLDKMSDEPYKDIATVGFLLGMYAVTTSLYGNGAISALTVGIILGNGESVRRMFRLPERGPVEGVTRRFHEQMSFILRTFFFVYLGSLFNIANPQAFLIGGAITAIIIGARLVSVLAASAGDSILRMDSWVMTILYPRGLAAAVLAQGFLQAGFPLAGETVDVVVSVILWSVVSSSLVVTLFPSQISLHLRLPTVAVRSKTERPRGKSPSHPEVEDLGSVVKSSIVAARSQMERPGVLVEGAAFGGFRPLLCFAYGQSSVLYEPVPGFDELRKVPEKIQVCQQAHLRGEVNFVVSDLVAYRTTSRLRLVESYCERAPNLGFKVRFLIYEAKKRRIVPLEAPEEESGPLKEGQKQVPRPMARIAEELAHLPTDDGYRHFA